MMRLSTIFLLLSSALLCFGLSYAPLISEQYAERGDAKVQYLLGLQYESGRRGAQDYVEAVKWYRKAAEQRNAMAQNNLGYMYDNGQGVDQDNVEAYMWYILAAAQGNENAKENKSMLSERMTREQIAEAQKLSRERSSKNSSSHATQ